MWKRKQSKEEGKEKKKKERIRRELNEKRLCFD
jgi:hypothetical protein